MKKLLFLLIFMFISSGAFSYDDGYDTGGTVARSVRTSKTNFSGNLSTADNTVQKALDTLDDLDVSGTTTTGWTKTGTDVHLTTSTDNVGIGTSTPSQTLDVVGTATISNTLNVDSSITADSMTLVGTGNVGIGTSAPLAELDLIGTQRIQGASNNCILTVDADNTCDAGTSIVVDNSIAICAVCTAN